MGIHGGYSLVGGENNSTSLIAPLHPTAVADYHWDLICVLIGLLVGTPTTAFGRLRRGVMLPAAEDLTNTEAKEPAVVGIELVFILQVEAELPFVW